MPVLAAYIGYSGVSVALEKQDGSFIYQRFPYTYSREIFSSICDEGTFYKQVLDSIARENKMKLSDFDVLLTSIVEFPVENFEVKFKADVASLISRHDEDYVVLIDTATVLTKDTALSQVPVNFLTNNEYYANLSIYPQLTTRDYADRVSMDGLIIEKVRREGIELTSDKPILFTGDRFAQRDYEPVFKYSLALDLFNSPGYYYVKIDKNNTVILSELIREYNQSISVNSPEEIENVGTFAVIPGDAEVLVTTVLETNQFFDLKKDTVFALPIDVSTPTRISVKSKSIGNLDGEILGGTLGVLFDTRVKRAQLISDAKVLNAFMKEIEEAVKGI